jgi:hypothetical protein
MDEHRRAYGPFERRYPYRRSEAGLLVALAGLLITVSGLLVTLYVRRPKVMVPQTAAGIGVAYAVWGT